MEWLTRFSIFCIMEPKFVSKMWKMYLWKINKYRKCIYLFERQSGKKRQREIFHSLVHSPNGCIHWTWPAWSPEPWTLPGSPLLGGRGQPCGPCSIDLLCMLAGSCRVPGTWTHTQMVAQLTIPGPRELCDFIFLILCAVHLLRFAFLSVLLCFSHYPHALLHCSLNILWNLAVSGKWMSNQVREHPYESQKAMLRWVGPVSPLVVTFEQGVRV